MGDVFDARELWASMGVPYQEPDLIKPLMVAVIRTMIFAGQWKVNSRLSVNATVVPAE